MENQYKAEVFKKYRPSFLSIIDAIILIIVSIILSQVRLRDLGMAIFQDNIVTQVFQYMIYAALIYVNVKVLYHILKTLTTEYLISESRIIIKEGVFSRRTDHIELYRTKDITIVQPFFLRLFDCGNLILKTSDWSSAVVVIKAQINPKNMMLEMRDNIEKQRALKGVREFD